ncbi:MAG: glutaredoxin family protein [Candidatus Nanopelagicales bacterium]
MATASEPRVTLVGKPDCHLCSEARAIIEQVCEELGVGWQELSILDDPELADRYWEQIPVTLIDGMQHDFWRVDPVRLRKKLVESN